MRMKSVHWQVRFACFSKDSAAGPAFTVPSVPVPSRSCRYRLHGTVGLAFTVLSLPPSRYRRSRIHGPVAPAFTVPSVLLVLDPCSRRHCAGDRTGTVLAGSIGLLRAIATERPRRAREMPGWASPASGRATVLIPFGVRRDAKGKGCRSEGRRTRRCLHGAGGADAGREGSGSPRRRRISPLLAPAWSGRQEPCRRQPGRTSGLANRHLSRTCRSRPRPDARTCAERVDRFTRLCGGFLFADGRSWLGLGAAAAGRLSSGAFPSRSVVTPKSLDRQAPVPATGPCALP